MSLLCVCHCSFFSQQRWTEKQLQRTTTAEIQSKKNGTKWDRKEEVSENGHHYLNKTKYR